jgi:hypothetical protein
MEQPCYKCGQPVEEGVAFCPHCAAPQIRVVLPEPAALAVAADGAAAGAAALPASDITPVLAVPMVWSRAIGPCAMAALLASAAMVLKLMVPLIAALAAGFLAVAFYRRRNPEVAINTGAGARLGALCGLLCFGMTSVFEALAVATLNKGDEIRRTMLDAIQQTAARYPDPQFQPGLDFMRSPGGLVFMMVFALIFGFLVFLLLGTAGGALGGVMLGRRNRN